MFIRTPRSKRITTSVLYVGAWVDGNRDFSIPRLTASSYSRGTWPASMAA
jgi:hypothetical protein